MQEDGGGKHQFRHQAVGSTPEHLPIPAALRRPKVSRVIIHHSFILSFINNTDIVALCQSTSTCHFSDTGVSSNAIATLSLTHSKGSFTCSPPTCHLWVLNSQ